jgi:uncharacterized protein with FMN-binding domain
MTEQATSVPEVTEDDDLDAQLDAMRQAEREDGGEQPENAEDSGQSENDAKPAADAGEKEMEPLSADEWKARHDNLKSALHEERSKRKENDEYRQKFAEIESRLAQLTPQQREDAKDEAEQRPDASKDPLAALDYALKKIEQYETVEQQRTQEAQQQQQQRQQLEQIQAYGAKAEETFRKEKADYDTAAQFYAESRLSELQTVYGMDQNAAQQYFRQELQAAIIQNAQRNQNPAAAIYAAAQARGYSPDADKQTDGTKQANSLQKMKDGQKASKTLSGTGGKVKTEATIESLLNADDDPLEAVHNNTESDFDRQFNAYARTARRA